jgi:hypothetical protein
MQKLFRISLMISAMAIALPVFAQSTTKFDGTYAGVSGNSNESGGTRCPPTPAPAPVTISNGTIQSSAGGAFQGTVGPDGRVVMHHSPDNLRYDGQIDGTGTLTAGGSSPRGCVYTYVWRKR